MQDLRISLVQADLAWEDVRQNLLRFDACLTPLVGKQELVLLPEMFNTGFIVQPEKVAETPGGPTSLWMSVKARELGCVVAGSLIVKEGGYFYNRLIWMRPDGSYETYDKRHLFRMQNEHLRFRAGKKKMIFDLCGWKICPMVCYDMRFPVWAKNTYKNGTYQYDLLLYVANWPEVRNLVWKTLLSARAMENICYVAGVNRIGTDGKGLTYSGNTRLIDCKGQVMQELPDHQEGIITFNLSAAELLEAREKFNVGLDWDNFTFPQL
ncbi:MAG: amidohydrolase [Bacteroidetes bacterium]|nr:amidohydrolase [Bacteroidota bacterium]